MRPSLIAALLALTACGGAEPTPAPEAPPVAEAPPAPPAEPGPVETPPAGAKVSFLELAEGATVGSPLVVKMGVEGMTVEPAGMVKPGTGHHHLIVDGQPVPQGEVVPKDEKHIHFGAGQTEHTLELGAGPHTLTLQFADGVHRSYGPAMSTTVNIVVSDKAGQPVLGQPPAPPAPGN